MFETIVVAIDGSDPSKRALEAACTLAKAFDSEVHLIHAREQKMMQTSSESAAAAAILQSATAQAEAAGVSPSSGTSVEGDPFEEIMTIAGLYGADLIVSGRRGLGGISGMFAGSTSQQIAKHANCAYLSIK